MKGWSPDEESELATLLTQMSERFLTDDAADVTRWYTARACPAMSRGGLPCWLTSVSRQCERPEGKNRLMRAHLRISSDQLRVSLRDQYGLTAATLAFLPLGQDTSARVYRVVSDQGDRYLLKARSTPVYEPSCLVPRYLKDQGIASVVAPLPTRRGGLWTQVEEWSLCLYPYIEGDSGWDPAYDDTAMERGGRGSPPCSPGATAVFGQGVAARRDIDPGEYRRRIDAFETQHVSHNGGSREEREVRAAWEAQREVIHTAISSLETLAAEVKERTGPYVICHADIHPSNIIRDDHGRVFVVDWDDVMLAPEERDFLFVEDSPIDTSTKDSSFFQGYGPADIDWRALAYFRWERVVQDVLEYARTACAGDRLGRAVRAEAVRRFGIAILPSGRMATAARGAEARLAG